MKERLRDFDLNRARLNRLSTDAANAFQHGFAAGLAAFLDLADNGFRVPDRFALLMRDGVCLSDQLLREALHRAYPEKAPPHHLRFAFEGGYQALWQCIGELGNSGDLWRPAERAGGG